MSPGSDGTWLEISVGCPPAASEAVTELMLELVPSGVCVRGEGLTVEVCAYLPAFGDTSPLLDAINSALNRVDTALIGGGRLALRTRAVAEEDWAESWKQHYHGRRIGERLVVKPSWEQWPPEGSGEEARANDLVIELDPGMAFGTGLHHTTQLCLEALERIVTPGLRLADIGCGSGILSIGAVLLGAESVLALDIDPLAVRVTEANCRINRVPEHIAAAQGSCLPDEAGVFDLIVANISAPVVAGLVAQMKAHLAEGGCLLLSGFTARGLPEVEAALAEAGLEPRERSESGDWLALLTEPIGGAN